MRYALEFNDGTDPIVGAGVLIFGADETDLISANAITGGTTDARGVLQAECPKWALLQFTTTNGGLASGYIQTGSFVSILVNPTTSVQPAAPPGYSGGGGGGGGPAPLVGYISYSADISGGQLTNGTITSATGSAPIAAATWDAATQAVEILYPDNYDGLVVCVEGTGTFFGTGVATGAVEPLLNFPDCDIPGNSPWNPSVTVTDGDVSTILLYPTASSHTLGGKDPAEHINVLLEDQGDNVFEGNTLHFSLTLKITPVSA